MPATFVRRERKHRRLAKQRDAKSSSAASTAQDDEDPNREIVFPSEPAAKDVRREQLRASLQAEGKVSSKKRKRLDHYIETKLKKEDNAELIRRLASQHVNTSLLQSSKTLGRVKESKRDILRRSLQEQEAGIDSYGDSHAILYTSNSQHPSSPSAVEVSEDDATSDVSTGVVDTTTGYDEQEPAGLSATTTRATFGSGLKYAVNPGEPGVVQRRKRRKTPKALESINDDDERVLDWQGFDTEDSSNDAQSDSEDSSNKSTYSMDSSERESGGDTPAVKQTGELRSSAFKRWAEAQRNTALNFTPSITTTTDPAVLAAFKPRLSSPDPATTVRNAGSLEQRALKAVVIERDPTIESKRIALPVVQEEQKIMEAINQHAIVIVCGATGSGKTTQVPQMMLESGYANRCGDKSSSEEMATWTMESKGMIGITQPRRVAALAVAERVKTELGPQYADRVAHHVRYDTDLSQRTALKFMTDGILLRELHQDFILSRYSAIIIDEAHERSVNTDILIGTMSRVVALRAELTKEDPNKHFPLKLIIMSATLRVADFIQNKRLFRELTPPIIEAEGRQHSVTIHFARRTHQDYESEMVRKITRAHRKLPPGTILAFLTGQNEIKAVMKQLQDAIGGSASRSTGVHVRFSSDQLPLETDDMDATKATNDVVEDDLDIIHLDESEDDDQDLDIEHEDDGAGPAAKTSLLRADILPLYAALPAEEQLRVFHPSPPGTRLIILATNVAETSLTIPGVRYVFDCGRSKEKKYDVTTGVSMFEIDWISKASAAQRTGRAGRTGPGHCWRLYSSALYEEHFPEHSTPEILRTPVESVVLSLKAMSIDNVPNFPFPTSPDRSQLQSAVRLLGNLGALERNGKLTQQGHELMHYPLNPRYGKILLLAARNKVVEHAIALVAALAVGEIFLPDALAHTLNEEHPIDDTQRSYGRAQSLMSRWDDQSDAIKMLTAVAVHAEAVSNDTRNGSRRICNELFLREKGMAEVQQLRIQLRSILKAQSKRAMAQAADLTLALPTADQRKMLKQIVVAAYLDQVAIRADLLPHVALPLQRPRRAIEVPYYTLFPTDKSLAPSPVFVHASSVLARLSKDEMPSYIVYSHLTRTASKTITNDTAKTRLHPLASTSGKVLAMLSQDTPLLQVGKPIGKIEEVEAGRRRMCWVGVSLRATSDVDGGPLGIEWPLPAWKVEQTRQRNGEWVVTRILSR